MRQILRFHSGPVLIRSGRWIYFADETEVDARANELTQIVRAWVAMTPQERGNK